MSQVGLVEYFTTPAATYIFSLIGDDEPELFEARLDGEPLTKGDLLRCAERLLIDFHGLPRGWDEDGGVERYRRALALPPAVNAAKRAQPVLERNLARPAFAYELTYWDHLSDALLPADLRARIDGCELLCVVPHGPLHALPFSALRWSPDEYLVERFGLCFAPSASVLPYCRAKNRARLRDDAPQSWLVAAVAARDDDDPGDFEVDGDVLAPLVSAQPGARLTELVGAAASGRRPPASKEGLLRAIEAHDVIHLACHGLFDVDGMQTAPLDDAGLLLSDGRSTLALAEFPSLTPAERAPFFLTAREIFALRLDAHLVTLRACSSGRAEVRSGDELLGLTRAFLYAGTPSLLVSLWNVHKRSSRRLLAEFYRHWLGEASLPKWRALQRAQRHLMSSPEYRHPYHWAPFVLVGDWV